MKEEQFINTIKDIQIKYEMKEKILYTAINMEVQVKNNRNILRNAIMGSCFILIILFCVISSYRFRHINPVSSLGPIPTIVSIKINDLNEEPKDIAFGDLLLTDDFITMTYKEILKYYNVSIPIEKFLPDLKIQNQEGNYGIYKNETRGGIYFDNNSFVLKSNDGKQKLIIILSKGTLPYTGFANIIEGYDSQLEPSTINGVEMTVAQYKDSYETYKYYAEFMFNNIGYKIYAQNFSYEEFSKALSVLVE